MCGTCFSGEGGTGASTLRWQLEGSSRLASEGSGIGGGESGSGKELGDSRPRESVGGDDMGDGVILES